MFKGFDYQVVVRAVIEKSSPGTIWVDDTAKPECGFMATTEGWFLAGNPNRMEFNKGLRELAHDMILRGNFRSPVNPNFLSYLFFHIDSNEWISRFPYIFDIRRPLPTYRIHFICDNVTLDWKNRIPEGYRLLQIDSSFDKDVLEFPGDIKERAEHSLEDQKKRGFGLCLLHGNKIVVWINADCASGDECEIGIITTEAYRRKGLGALAAAASVDNCLSSGYSTVGWHCENHNYGSIAVAQKVGFVKERDYVHYICMVDEAEHLAESAMRHFYNRLYNDAILDFQRAFGIGDVHAWFYTLAAKSYAAIGNRAEAFEHFMEAKRRGWSNWDEILHDDILKSFFSKGEWSMLAKELT